MQLRIQRQSGKLQTAHAHSAAHNQLTAQEAEGGPVALDEVLQSGLFKGFGYSKKKAAAGDESQALPTVGEVGDMGKRLRDRLLPYHIIEGISAEPVKRKGKVITSDPHPAPGTRRSVLLLPKAAPRPGHLGRSDCPPDTQSQDTSSYKTHRLM